MRFLIITCLVATFISINAEYYNGYHLIRIFPVKELHIKQIEALELNDPKFDVWGAVRAEPVSFDVSLPPITFLKYKALFESEDIKFEVLNSNLQNEITAQKKQMIESSKRDSSIIFKYARYQQIMDFVDATVEANPDIATSYVAGTTGEGRDLKVIVLNPVKTSTRSLWIDCGIHAREWVSPATCVYTIDTLIKEFKNNDPETVAIFNKYQIHIMPVVNADGYEYSMTISRLWRKNRNANKFSSCIGVDLNRNFGYKWMTGGASSSPCSDVFAGPNADSELEVQAVQSALRNRAGNWDSYFNVHSYGNWWLLPWGYQYTFFDEPADYKEMMEKATIATDAIKSVYGEVFEAGASSNMLYINSGSGKDWAYGELGIKYSYVLELRPGLNSPDYRYGFMLPEDRMPLVATETYAGMKALYFSLV